MKLKIVPLLIILFTSGGLKAQLLPVGTKLHIAEMPSYIETQYQRYTNTVIDTITINNHVYSSISYPDHHKTKIDIRIEENKLYELVNYHTYIKDELLFDFNVELGDSIDIIIPYVLYFPYDVQHIPAKVKIINIAYEYYYNELNKLDSSKSFDYCGIVTIPNIIGGGDTTFITQQICTTIIEKLLTVITTYGNYFLIKKLGGVAAADDHQRLRCVELPDGKMMKMKWWYDMAGNNIPCNYTFNLGNEELKSQTPIVLFPNPASNQVTIKNYSGTLTFYNQLGQYILRQTVDQETPIDIKSLPIGLYTIKLENNYLLPLSIIR